MIQTVVTVLFTLISTLVCATSAIVVSFVTRGGNWSHLVGRLWGRSILWVSRVKVTVQGLERIDPGAPYVYMANHQSMFDILVLLGHLPVQFRWLAKKELFRIPVFGYSMARVGYISIDRSNRKSAIRSLRVAAEKIAQGVSVVVFPEGTRSHDGKMKPFKKGGFYLAIDSRQPIVPVVIYGSHEVMPKGLLRVRSGEIILSINPPVKTASYQRATKEALMERIWEIMEQDLARLGAVKAEVFQEGALGGNSS
jgi:1-acyl-sn-glycerol-3-phosphate acyltransferase